MGTIHDYWQDLIRKDKYSPHHLVHLSRVHMGEGNHEKAAHHLRQAIRRHPGDAHAWNHMAYLIKQPKKGDVTILKHCFGELNAVHPTPEAHVWHTVRKECSLEDIEKFAEVGYTVYRDSHHYPFLRFLFKALSEVKSERTHVLLNLDWYNYGSELTIPEDIPELKLNIFAPSFETVTQIADKNLLLMGNVRHIQFVHDCKLYISSPHSIALHQVNHSGGVYIRSSVRGYDRLSGSKIKVGGNINLSELRACSGNTLWIYGEAQELGTQGRNAVYVRRTNVKEGESPWWYSKVA